MRKIFRGLSLLGVMVCVGMLGVLPAGATLLGTFPTPPSTTVPAFLVPPGTSPGTLLADMVQSFSISTAVGLESGTIQSAVYQESGGTLDFYYQLSNTSPDGDTLSREDDSSFLGFLTNTGFRIDGSTLAGTTFIDGTIAPITADSNGTGSVIGFNFNPPTSAEIPAGSSSNVLVISTNATNFKIGTASAIDSGTGTVQAFEPASNVPEPASIALLGSILFGIAAIGRRRLSRKA